MIRIRTVEPLEPFTVRIVFTNDERRDIDLTPYIQRGPIFAPIRDDPAYFRSVRVEGGTVAWPNGADIDPDVLYLGLAPNASQDEWEAAKGEAEHASRR